VWRPRPICRAELAAVLVLALPALGAAQSAAANPELVTDRPGFGESSAVVGRATLQVETGLVVARADHEHPRDTTGQVLLRAGVSSRVELRFAVDGHDVEVGGKVKLLDAARAGIDLAVIPYVSRDPGFKVAGGRGLPHGFELSGTFNATDGRTASGRAWQHEISLSLDHTLGARLGAYGEVDAAFAGQECACSVDGGITIGVGAHGQFDVEAGHRVHGEAQDWFMGVGFAVRRLHR
jgi:hypothetical protein